MSQVSKIPLKTNDYQRIFSLFINALHKLKTKNQIENFFLELLTPTERIMLAKRIVIAYLLARGYDYRYISEKIKVSTSTVASVNHTYKSNGQLAKTVTKLIEDKKLEDFWIGTLEPAAKALTFSPTKSGAWRTLHHELKNTKEEF